MVSIFTRDFRLSDVFHPKSGDVFCEDTDSARPTEKDPFADRLDVAGFKEKPRTLFPFLTKLEIQHPSNGSDTDVTTVIVLDLDEVAATAAGSDSGGSVIGESLLLGGAGFVALWFGTKASLERIIETTGELDDLKTQRSELEEAIKNAKHSGMSDTSLERFRQNIETILWENKKDRRYLKSDRLFSGIIGGSGATTIAVGTFLEVPLYASEASAAAGATALSIAAPVVSTFALGVAAQQAHRSYKAYILSPKIAQAIENAHSLVEKEVYTLLLDRSELAHKIHSARAVSMTLLGIGAPLTVFGGPYGLAVLLPGVVGSIVAGYIDSRKLGYVPQLSWQEKAQLDGKPAIINAIKSAHDEYLLLKSIKSNMRLRYPIGRNAPKPFNWLAKGVAYLRRKSDGDYKDTPPQVTFFNFLSGKIKIDKETLDRSLIEIQNELQSLNDSDQIRRDELVTKLNQCQEELAQLGLEESILNRAESADCSPDYAMFCLLQFLIRNKLFPKFSEQLLKDRKLKKALMKNGVITKTKDEYHVDANKLVLMLTAKESSQTDTRLAARLLLKGQDILLTAAKDRAHFKERQLLDFLAAHMVHDENFEPKLSFINRLKLAISGSHV